MQPEASFCLLTAIRILHLFQSGKQVRVKVVLLVLDSVGIGEAPDASAYDDTGAATLPRTARAAGGLFIPHLQALGIGNIPSLLPDGLPICGVPPENNPQADYGAMRQISQGKDTIVGHWEIAGLDMRPGFHIFPPEYPSIPSPIIDPLRERTGRHILANCAASGTTVIEELGSQQMDEGSIIVYTSNDSVLQIAAHVDIIPLKELYEICLIARTLCDPYRVGRVIARPFSGRPGSFTRTKDRKDFALKTGDSTILDQLSTSNVPVYAVGKINDIFSGNGIVSSDCTGDNVTSQAAAERFHQQMDFGLLFANFIDFDMLYGHRRDPQGYAQCLEQTDQWLGKFLATLAANDLLIITADHGNDPTFKGTGHTREYVPLLVHRPGQRGESLGIRQGFFDVAQSLAALFNLPAYPRGEPFL